VELSGLIPLLVNAGTAGVVLAVFLFLMISGHLVAGRMYRDKQEECDELKAALASERARGDAAVAAAAATRDLLLAFQGARSVAQKEG
jgi:hypothetical protein